MARTPEFQELLDAYNKAIEKRDTKIILMMKKTGEADFSEEIAAIKKAENDIDEYLRGLT